MSRSRDSADPIGISVCMATFNGQSFVVEQLRSILEQLPENSEVVVSDDHSTDLTVSLVKNIKDSRIRVIQNKLQPGVSGNFQNALEHARGDIIFLSDQDDIWLPGKVAALLDHLEVVMLVCHDCRLIGVRGEVISDSLFKLLNAQPGILRNILRNSYTGCCMAFRRELLDIALPVPPSVYMHDVWLGVVAELYDDVRFVRQPLLDFRRHKNTLTGTGAFSNNSLPRKAAMRLLLCWHLMLRWLSITFRQKFKYRSF